MNHAQLRQADRRTRPEMHGAPAAGPGRAQHVIALRDARWRHARVHGPAKDEPGSVKFARVI